MAALAKLLPENGSCGNLWADMKRLTVQLFWCLFPRELLTKKL